MSTNQLTNFYVKTFWSDAERDQLRQLYAEGHGITTIAQVLKRTKYSVTSEIKTLNLPKEGRPVKLPPSKAKSPLPASNQQPKHPAQPIPRGVRTLPLLPSEIAAAAQAKATSEGSEGAGPNTVSPARS